MRRQACTSAQQRIWHVCQRLAPSALYHIGFGVLLNAEIDLNKVRHVLTQIVQRHEILQSRFLWQRNENGLKTIAREQAICEINLYQRESLHDEKVEAELEKIAQLERSTHMDLSANPLVRCTAVRFRQTTALIILMHQMISDNWSLNLFAHEMNMLYLNLLTQHKNYGHMLYQPTQFADYVNYQVECSQHRHFIQAWAYWQDRLKAIPKAVEINARTVHQSCTQTEFAECRRSFASECMHALKQTVQFYHSTLFHLLLIAFRLASDNLHTIYSDVITVPKSDRSHPVLQKMIGNLTQYIPIRLESMNKLPLIEKVAAMVQLIKSDMQQTPVPIEHLSLALDLEQNSSLNPCFQTFFSVHNYAVPAKLFGAEVIKGFEYFDLNEFNLNVKVILKGDDSADMLIYYHTHIHSATTISQLIDRFYFILDEIIKTNVDDDFQNGE